MKKVHEETETAQEEMKKQADQGRKKTKN